MTEHQIQCQLIKWYRMSAPKRLRPLLFAIPNGGARSAITGAMLKAEGVAAGVPDLFLAHPAGGWHGMFLELKAGRGALSAAQAAMIDLLRGQGYHAACAWGFAQAVDCLESYLRLR